MKLEGLFGKIPTKYQPIMRERICIPLLTLDNRFSGHVFQLKKEQKSDLFMSELYNPSFFFSHEVGKNIGHDEMITEILF